jgi:hypothetical protein
MRARNILRQDAHLVDESSEGRALAAVLGKDIAMGQ